MGASFVGVVGAVVVVDICISSSLRIWIVAVFNRKLAQHICDDLVHHPQLMVAGNGLQVPPAFAVNTASPQFLAGLDHVEYRNVPRVAGECVSALNPVVGDQHPSCGKSLEDLGQCVMRQSIALRQVMGAERTLASVLCQVLRSEETVTRSPS